MKHSAPETLSAAHQASASEVSALAEQLRKDAEPYALATVVRTISMTAAKAGAKAVIAADGHIAGGWIGGGCARSAVIKAAKAAIEDGEPKLISLQPEDLLAELGVEAGDNRQGVQFAKNMCPSQGTMDIFVEPVLPRPKLVILGASPVAVALARQGPNIGFECVAHASLEDLSAFPEFCDLKDGFIIPENSNAERYLVVSTQGRGDLAALESALAANSKHIAFVGSHRKIAHLKAKLREKGIREESLDRIDGPAGLDLGAITPEEIALSILAELLMVRRRGQRGTDVHHI